MTKERKTAKVDNLCHLPISLVIFPVNVLNCYYCCCSFCQKSHYITSLGRHCLPSSSNWPPHNWFSDFIAIYCSGQSSSFACLITSDGNRFTVANCNRVELMLSFFPFSISKWLKPAPTHTQLKQRVIQSTWKKKQKVVWIQGSIQRQLTE